MYCHCLDKFLFFFVFNMEHFPMLAWTEQGQVEATVRAHDRQRAAQTTTTSAFLALLVVLVLLLALAHPGPGPVPDMVVSRARWPDALNPPSPEVQWGSTTFRYDPVRVCNSTATLARCWAPWNRTVGPTGLTHQGFSLVCDESSTPASNGTQVYPPEQAASAIACLCDALDYTARLGSESLPIPPAATRAILHQWMSVLHTPWFSNDIDTHPSQWNTLRNHPFAIPAWFHFIHTTSPGAALDVKGATIPVTGKDYARYMAPTETPYNRTTAMETVARTLTRQQPGIPGNHSTLDTTWREFMRLYDGPLQWPRDMRDESRQGTQQRWNQGPAWMLEALYGNTPERTRVLRSNMSRGALRVTPDDYPWRWTDLQTVLVPTHTQTTHTNTQTFLMDTLDATEQTSLGLQADDVAAWIAGGHPSLNQHAPHVVWHTVLVREHNRIAARIATEHPLWTDSDVFHGTHRVMSQLVTWIHVQERIRDDARVAEFSAWHTWPTFRDVSRLVYRYVLFPTTPTLEWALRPQEHVPSQWQWTVRDPMTGQRSDSSTSPAGALRWRPGFVTQHATSLCEVAHLLKRTHVPDTYTVPSAWVDVVTRHVVQTRTWGFASFSGYGGNASELEPQTRMAYASEEDVDWFVGVSQQGFPSSWGWHDLWTSWFSNTWMHGPYDEEEAATGLRDVHLYIARTTRSSLLNRHVRCPTTHDDDYWH